MSESEDKPAEALASPVVCAADELLGAPVTDAAGNRLGRLSHIMIEASSGAIIFGIVDFGYLLVRDGKLGPIPWRLLKPWDGGRKLRLDVEPEVLRSAPAFDPGDWPDMSDPRWSARVHAHFGLRSQ